MVKATVKRSKKIPIKTCCICFDSIDRRHEARITIAVGIDTIINALKSGAIGIIHAHNAGVISIGLYV